MKRRDAAFFAGMAVFVVGVLLGIGLALLNFWVYPEMTKAAMFWAYPWQHTAAFVLVIGGGASMQWGLG